MLEERDMGFFCAIDFETSGPNEGDVCAIGMVKIEDGRLTDTFVSLVRPPSSFVQYTYVHGLTWSKLCNKPTFPVLWPKIEAFMAGAEGFVAHNAPFDRGVLYGACRHFGLAAPTAPFYCTVKGSRRALKLPSNRLNDVCAHFKIPLKHHEALSDAKACATIFLRLRELGLPEKDMKLGPPRPKRPRWS